MPSGASGAGPPLQEWIEHASASGVGSGPQVGKGAFAQGVIDRGDELGVEQLSPAFVPGSAHRLQGGLERCMSESKGFGRVPVAPQHLGGRTALTCPGEQLNGLGGDLAIRAARLFDRAAEREVLSHPAQHAPYVAQFAARAGSSC